MNAKISEAELGYIAGIVDGEGTIYWNRQGERGTIYMRVVQADRRLIDWLHERTACGYIYTHDDWGTLGKQRIWSWTVNGTQAAFIIRRLLPYLIVKRERAEEILALWEAAGAAQARPGRRVAAEERTADTLAAHGW